MDGRVARLDGGSCNRRRTRGPEAGALPHSAAGRRDQIPSRPSRSRLARARSHNTRGTLAREHVARPARRTRHSHVNGFFPGNQPGLKVESASQRIGASIDRIASVIWGKSMKPDFIGGRVVLLVKSVARDGMRYHAAPGKLDVVGAGEETLLGMGILHEFRAAPGELRAER